MTEIKSEIKKNCSFVGFGGGDIETKRVSQTVKRGQIKKQQLSTQCSVWYNKHLKIVNNFE